ncbi:MAG: threonylcarbamoyl-AMP synthase [Thermoplasmata archaeon]|nr:MAG: threonylcarbamoyl-AMP synthase [Thermoplasmata archaeon]
MQSEIKKAIKILKEGKLVVYPTDTLYGLGADIFNEEAVKKVYEVKKRPLSMSLPIALASVDEIEEYAFMNNLAYKIAEEFMPGGITIILKKKRNIPDVVAKEKIAIRVPDCEVAREIAKNVPITATSANLHKRENPVTIEIAKKQLGNSIALYIDAGKLPGIPSTIVDVSEGKIKILREGAIKKEEIYGRI